MGRLKIGKVNIDDQNKNLATQHGHSSHPHAIGVLRNGEVADQIVGFEKANGI